MEAFRGRVLEGKTVVFGEVGLSGEVRPVYNGEERLKEAAGLGFTRAIIPAANKPRTQESQAGSACRPSNTAAATSVTAPEKAI